MAPRQQSMLAHTIKVYADTRGGGTCRDCHARITWAEVVGNGKRPFDGNPVALRTHHDWSCRLIEELDLEDSHWKTCEGRR